MSRVPSRALIAGLFDGLVDDAAIFPPGNAPLPVALRAHMDYVDTRYESALGPFLVRASMVDELRLLADPASLVRVGLIADTGLAGAIAGPRRPTGRCLVRAGPGGNCAGADADARSPRSSSSRICPSPCRPTSKSRTAWIPKPPSRLSQPTVRNARSFVVVPSAFHRQTS